MTTVAQDDKPPQVTWLLPVLNGMPFLTETLASIAAQSYPHWQVLAWDNGSTDGSADVLRQWIPARLPGLVVTDRPMGLGDSLAAMVSIAVTPLCARIDADDVNLPDRLGRQVNFLEAHPDVAAVGGQMLLIDEHGGDRGLHHALPLTDAAIVADMLDGPAMGHPAVLFRREAVLAAGNYRNVGPVNVEDYDLWLRLAVRHRLANLDMPVIRYRVHARSATVIAELEGRLHGATMARLAECGAPLFGCSPNDAARLAGRRHPLAVIVVLRIARHLANRSDISIWTVLRSLTFVRAARRLVAPWDFASRLTLWVLAKRPSLFVRRLCQSLRRTS